MSDEIMRPIYGMQQDHRANRSAAEEIDAIDQVANHIEAQATRIAKLEAALRGLLTPQTPASFAGSMRVARAALEGGEDDHK